MQPEKPDQCIKHVSHGLKKAVTALPPLIISFFLRWATSCHPANHLVECDNLLAEGGMFFCLCVCILYVCWYLYFECFSVLVAMHYPNYGSKITVIHFACIVL